jgi:hypothetical protein
VCSGVLDISSDPPARSSPRLKKPSMPISFAPLLYFWKSFSICFRRCSACDCAFETVCFCGVVGPPDRPPGLLRPSDRASFKRPMSASLFPFSPSEQAPHQSRSSATFIFFNFASSGICDWCRLASRHIRGKRKMTKRLGVLVRETNAAQKLAKAHIMQRILRKAPQAPEDRGYKGGIRDTTELRFIVLVPLCFSLAALWPICTSDKPAAEALFVPPTLKPTTLRPFGRAQNNTNPTPASANTR